MSNHNYSSVQSVLEYTISKNCNSIIFDLDTTKIRLEVKSVHKYIIYSYLFI